MVQMRDNFSLNVNSQFSCTPPRSYWSYLGLQDTNFAIVKADNNFQQSGTLLINVILHNVMSYTVGNCGCARA